MNMKRRIFSLFLVLLLLLPMVLTGCGEEEPTQKIQAYTPNFSTDRLVEGKDGTGADADGKFLIDENDSFAMYWHDDRQAALLYDKVNDA